MTYTMLGGQEAMRYMFLVYTQEGKEAQMSTEELAELMGGHKAVMEETSRLGILRGAEPLKPTTTATTVRHQNGRPIVTDGPFAETKEQLGGYYIIDCKNLDEAIEWAKKIPTRCGGSQGCIEIRPLQDISELENSIQQGPAAQHA
jgi:hypothetical protein